MRLGWLALILLGGCGGKVVVDGLDDSADTPCAKACAIKAAECGEDERCVEMCESNGHEACAREHDTLLGCILDADDPFGCGPGQGVPGSCQDLYEAWAFCVSGS